MKKYIASYQDKRGDCWALIINANSWKEASKDARTQQKEYGKLYSVRLYKVN